MRLMDDSHGATPDASDGTTLTGLHRMLVDLGVLAIVFLAPLFMGGRGPVGKFVLICIVCVTIAAWAIGQCRLPRGGQLRRSGVEWLLLASVVLVALQLVPLPPALLAKISPSISELLPLWSSSSSTAVHMGQWQTISLAPEATRGALAVLLAYIMLFTLLVQRLDSLDDIATILRWVAVGTIFLAVLGLAQLLFGNGKFLWVYEHPSRDTFHSVKGPFHNQNHFAHLLALGVGPIILSWTRAPARSLEKHLFGIGLGLVLVAGLLTFSRGGVLSITIASAATLAIFLWKSLIDKRAILVAGGMVAAVAVALLIHGYGPLSSRFAALGESSSLDEAAGARADLWSAIIDGIPHFVWLGSGIGSHRDVYPLFMEEHYDVEFTHGENGYLPLTLEGGAPAFLLLIIGIVICFWWCYRALATPALSGKKVATAPSRHPWSTARTGRGQPERLSGVACTAAVFPGLLASVLHSLTDFVWYVSTCMSFTLLLAACACRLYQLGRQTQARHRTGGSLPSCATGSLVRLPQPAWIGVSIILVIAGASMIYDRQGEALAAPHWNAYRKLALPTYQEVLPEEAIERDYLFQMGNHLTKVLQRDPTNPRANLRFSATCLRRFELEQRHAINPMGLQQIREAAFASQFASREAQDAWLNVAIGKNRELLDLALTHCRRALRNGPLQGDGYIYLADLSFLEGPDTATKDAYIAQAFLVRPHNSAVAFAMGQERALAGDLDGALNLWREAFHQDPRIQALIVEQFSPNAPAAFFLESFQPNAAALRRLKDNYQRIGQTADAQVVARRLTEVLTADVSGADGAGNAAAWFELQSVYRFLQDVPAAVRCARQAVELEGNNFDYRRVLAALLLQSEDYEGATREFEWCLRRKPDDPKLLAQLKEANRGRVEHRSAQTLSAGIRY